MRDGKERECKSRVKNIQDENKSTISGFEDSLYIYMLKQWILQHRYDIKHMNNVLCAFLLCLPHK